MIRPGPVSNVVGVALLGLSMFMLLCVPCGLIYGESVTYLLISASITAVAGGISWFYRFQEANDLSKREGYFIVLISWVTISLCGALPYFVSGTIVGVTDAVFESVSGLTTTGATILTQIEDAPRSLLLWRSMTQWIGGMGFIVLTIAIFPLLGVGGVELFVAEAPGPTSSKIHPRIRGAATRLWILYTGITASSILILWAEGMTLFDAINHGLTCIATGGFSTHSDSIGYFPPLIQYTILAFMVIGGINYTITWFALTRRWKKVWSSDEFRAYLGFLGIAIVLVTVLVQMTEDHTWEVSFRESSFMIVSLVTTTGYVTADYTAWTPGIAMMFYLLLFAGGCAGSTSGGIKIVRHYVFFRNSWLEFKRLLHPNALVRIKIDDKIVPPRVLTHILVFFLLYVLIFVIGSITMAFLLEDYDDVILTSIGAVATSLGNVGPAIGSVGPMDHFAHLPSSAKWLCTVLMIIGRLELFTFLIVFTPFFWRVN